MSGYSAPFGLQMVNNLLAVFYFWSYSEHYENITEVP